MPLEIKKQNKENSLILIRRFSKALQGAGILLKARKIRFKERKKSAEMKKRAALRREELKKEFEKLKKLGKI